MSERPVAESGQQSRLERRGVPDEHGFDFAGDCRAGLGRQVVERTADREDLPWIDAAVRESPGESLAMVEDAAESDHSRGVASSDAQDVTQPLGRVCRTGGLRQAAEARFPGQASLESQDLAGRDRGRRQQRHDIAVVDVVHR